MRIDYAIFGEQNNGHGLLASSGNPEFAAKLTVLTDRPGDPPVGADWGPVVSGFVFDEHYVFLRMQPDPTRRAGMVRTYAAYVPLKNLDGINNLLFLFSNLPLGLDSPLAPIDPLQIPDSDLAIKPDPVQASARFALARLLLAPESKLPLLWNSAESYLPTVATLWAQLPPGLRKNFSFQFLFAPEHHTAMVPTLIATMPDLSGRWPDASLVNMNETKPHTLTPAESWLAGTGDGAQFDITLREYSIDLPQFDRLSLIASFADMINRLATLSFVETRKAVNIAAKYSRCNASSTPHRAMLFARLCTLTEACTSQEMLMLRNLDEASLSDLIPDLQRAMKTSVDARNTKGPSETADIELLETAVAERTNWWGAPLIEWLKQAARIANAADVERLIRLAASVVVLEVVADKLQSSAEVENQIIKHLPRKIATASAENLATLAVKRGWMKLHAECLARSLTAAEAIKRHADVAGASEAGLMVLESSLGFKSLLQVACKTGSPSLVAFVGSAIGRDPKTHLSTLPTRCEYELHVLLHAVNASVSPFSSELRSRLLLILNGSEPVDASVIDLSTAIIARDASLLTDLVAPSVFIARLPEGERQQADSTFENWLRAEIQAGRPVQLKNQVGFIQWFGERPVLQWLSETSTATAVRVGINAFRSLCFLADADCKKWLIELFTRTQNDRLNALDARALADFLGTVDFPESAKIIRETAVDYNRSDVLPVHEQIRYKYQMARAYPHKSAASSSRMHKVLIVTALPLERSAIISHLPTTTYDPGLQADVALWPEVNPYYEIYIVTSGPGNLAVQTAGHRILKSGVKPRLAFFAGVCGGVKDSEIGDVIFSTKVYYTEGGKEEDDGVKARPAMKETADTLVQLAIRVAEKQWQPTENSGASRLPKASPAVIAASEQVLASTLPTAESYQRIKKSYNDTQVVDMEAYGFLKVMQDNDVKLSMVLRGLSDKIEKKAESDAQGNQPLAAKNVSAFLFTLLDSCRPLLDTKKRKKKGLISFLFGKNDEA